MKRILSIPVCLASLWLVACASNAPVANEPARAERADTHKRARHGNVVSVTDETGTVAVEKLPFRPGTSSATVEKLARGAGCSGPAAGLITEKGPVEVYRMQCDDGRVFLARCELRQCRPMR
ncbi:hypothetical protein [Noviherbaspirillum aridicola]|uniref:Lipoprotein n=1 Tax=Noviherbaspirillum aridicola TaxID=2849687 RepID=A0ABQ4Q368_9BURK|nr:hypothetical protein [Noviherbaspirillum aridicola]GIZ51549.1 hypothetical protein NCCP691_15630 [Noviherbaspirillum aridicola]